MFSRKKKKQKGQVTFTHQELPKSYDEMTWEEKWEWAGEFLSGIKPEQSEKS